MYTYFFDFSDFYLNIYIFINQCWYLFLGLSPDLASMEQIRRIMRPTDVPDAGLFNYYFQYGVLYELDNINLNSILNNR